MSDLMKLIHEADVASVEYEKARAQVEAAKTALENAKEQQEQARSALDEIISRADEHGVPRAKVKKLIEERTQTLMASGLIPATEPRASAAPKAPRSAKKSKPAAEVSEKDDFIAMNDDEDQSLGLAN